MPSPPSLRVEPLPLLYLRNTSVSETERDAAFGSVVANERGPPMRTPAVRDTKLFSQNFSYRRVVRYPNIFSKHFNSTRISVRLQIWKFTKLNSTMIEPFGVLKQIFKIDKMFLIFLIFQFFTFVELKKFVNVTF